MRFELETKRLILRPLTMDDFDAVHSWGSNPVNTRYMGWGPSTEEQTRDFLSSVKPGKDFAVVLKETGEVIGSCGIYPDNKNDTAELGWILHIDYWKHGYGTELGGELIRYGFEDLKLRRIFAPCAAVNYGSYRVMERNGMRREALHVKAFWARVDKEWIDEAIYAILAEDYFGSAQKMSKPHSIILLGANGSGKSTLGRELARVLNFAHIDVEDYYFYQADIPYTAMRPAEERNEMLLSDMKKHGSFVMSGDVSGWGEEFLTKFDLVIFLSAPTDIRLKRIDKRENERWGDRIRKGGDMYEQSQNFREFAASRDIPQLEQKASLYSCPILRVDGTKTPDENIDDILTDMKFSSAKQWEANR